MESVSAPQSPEVIGSILERLNGHEIAALQVLGINSLKSVDPPPHALAGLTIKSTGVSDRVFRLLVGAYEVVIDLQRTGKVVWLDSAEPFQMAPDVTRPTVRLILADGTGIDLTEPAKTKRITVALTRLDG